VVDFAKQVHDWNPGIKRSGLFWTRFFPRMQVGDNADAGWARMRATNMAVPDFGTFENSVSPHPVKHPGHVSFDIVWHPHGRKQHIRDRTFDFAVDGFAGEVSVEFTARVDGSPVIYRSLPGGQKTLISGVGRERNGVFFP
jgi:hypothetical protein